jgi:hypothetical protein
MANAWHRMIAQFTRSVSLRTDGQGRWRHGDGRVIDDLDGCIDIDIWPTPALPTDSISSRISMAVASRRSFAWTKTPS